MTESPRIKDSATDKYVVTLERTCPHCNYEVIKDYDRETLRMLLGTMPLIDCPHCQKRF